MSANWTRILRCAPLLLATFAASAVVTSACLADTDQDLKDACQLIGNGKYAEAIAKYQSIMAADQTPEVVSQIWWKLGVGFLQTS